MIFKLNSFILKKVSDRKFSLIIILLTITLIPAFAEPAILDSNFVLEKFVTGLDFPVQMDFIGNDILIIQKNDGQVRLVENGVLLQEPVLVLDVENRGLEGLLGIHVVDSSVYLYVTQLSQIETEPEVNRIYKYEWVDKKLINPILVNELPANPKFHDHVGGAITSDSQKNVYAVIGDLFRWGYPQNSGTGEFDDSGIILRVGIDKTVQRPYLTENPSDYYYAIGIRNSFGLEFDPITDHMWDTENGPIDNDEVNLVLPNFNSGWKKIMGPISNSDITTPKIAGFTYSDPEFTWINPVGPTGLFFFNSEPFKDYDDYLLVGGVQTGMIYKFKLNSTRTGFDFQNPELRDLVANPGDSMDEIIFGTGFNGIVDFEEGSDGLLYLLTIFDGGSIFKVLPVSESTKILSPKKQLDIGILPNEIQCKDGFVLIMKSFESLACTKPQTAITLLENNWGYIVNEPLKNNCSNPPQPKVNWSGCNFSFTNLKGINLEQANLQKINLSGADLSKTNLKNADFTGANLISANLTEANLSKSIMKLSRLTQANLKNAILQEVDLTKSSLTNADFSNADLSHAKLDGAYLNFAVLNNTNLSDSDLSNANFSHIDLSNANLKNANFTNTNLNDANLTNANLDGVKLSTLQISKCYGHENCE